jgi:hypothetical protein
MKSLSYEGHFGPLIKKIDIDLVSGAGGTATWNIFVNRMYEGSVQLQDDLLRFLPGPRCTVQPEDQAALLDVVDRFCR